MLYVGWCVCYVSFRAYVISLISCVRYLCRFVRTLYVSFRVYVICVVLRIRYVSFRVYVIRVVLRMRYICVIFLVEL